MNYPKLLTYDDAMTALLHGATLRLVDDGHGLVLPGICKAMHQDNQLMALNEEFNAAYNFVAMEMLICNICPLDNKGHYICRYRTVHSFSEASIWAVVENVEEMLSSEASKTTPFDVSKNNDKVDISQFFNILKSKKTKN